MSEHEHESGRTFRPHCCPCCRPEESEGITRRGFLGGMAAAIGGMALAYLSMSELMAGEKAIAGGAAAQAAGRQAGTELRHAYPPNADELAQLGWNPNPAGRRGGGGAHPRRAREASARPPISRSRSCPWPWDATHAELASAKEEIASADVVVLYAAGGWAFDFVAKTAKDVIFFCRHKSGPVYLWYEIISPRYLRQHSDALKVQGHDDQDVVIDSQDELLWRFRALGGLKNTRGSRVIAMGGPGGWATPTAPKLAKDVWDLDIQTVSYEELGELIKAARADAGRRRQRPPPRRRVSPRPRASAWKPIASSSRTPSCWRPSSAA